MKNVPSHLNLALTVFAFIMIISVILAYAFKWLGLVDDVLLMIIIISTISLGVVVPTLKRNEYNAYNYRSIYIISSRIGRPSNDGTVNYLRWYQW